MSEQPAAPALLVEGLTKRYGPQSALEGVSFQVEVGGAYGLAGPNGGGKSTLLRIAATLERPTAGRVVVHGLDTAEAPRAARRLIGYAGPPGAAGELTVAEELTFAAELAGLPRADRAETVAAMLQLTDLYDRRLRPVGQLSRGDLKRLSIARALVHDPALLLLDCPFDGLDASARAELRAVLGELAALGKTLLVTASTMGELAGLCQEVGLLDRGRLLLSGPAESILAAGEPGRPLRLTLAGGLDAARSRLEASPLVRAVQPIDEARLAFRFAGDHEQQAALVADLLAAGALVVELAPAPDEAEAELTRAVRASA